MTDQGRIVRQHSMTEEQDSRVRQQSKAAEHDRARQQNLVKQDS